MYTLKKGILYKNGKKVFCTGLSYYASYHASKVPVPPEGDRIGEICKEHRPRGHNRVKNYINTGKGKKL